MKAILFAAVLAAHAADSSKPGTVFRDCADCPEMVALAAGSFTMGSTKAETDRAELPDEQGARERPAHTVTFARPFAIGKYEITVDEYTAFANATARRATDNCITWDETAAKWGPVATATWKNPGYAQTGRFPVGCVTIDDARAYAAWLAQKSGKPYRIPSEAEWEYAARAGTRTMQTWGDSFDGICKFANVSDRTRMDKHTTVERDPTRYFDCEDGFIYAAPVGSFPPDRWGLYDMVGNIWEWTEDCFIPHYNGAPTDGSVRRDPSQCDRLIVRSGGWYSRNWFARPAGRSRENPDYRSSTLGIRVARTLD
jgi:formylglycine-generating enzyme required for sulfatase activity